MIGDFLLKYKIAVRKKIAALKISGKKLEIKSEKAKIRTIPEASDLFDTIHKSEHNSKNRITCGQCIRMAEEIQGELTFGKLISTLETILKEETNEAEQEGSSQTRLRRLALISSVLDYYRSLSVDPQTKVIEDITQYKTIHSLAPDKKKIYDIWLRKLVDLTKEQNPNHLEEEEFDESINKGIERGGAFEKQLERFREEFVKRMLYS